jgi:hypothetical protein
MGCEEPEIVELVRPKRKRSRDARLASRYLAMQVPYGYKEAERRAMFSI